jgi:hypothetical protein
MNNKTIISLVVLFLGLVGCAPRGGDYGGSVSYPDPIAAVNAHIAARDTNPVVIGNDPAALVQFTRDVGRCNALLVAQGKTAEEAIERCATSTPPLGVRIPAAAGGDEGDTRDVAPAPPPAAPQVVDMTARAPVFTGILGNIRPKGCSDATCLNFSGLPTVNHGKWMCDAISVRLDDREVYWLNGANMVETAYVEPGDGFDTLGGNRVSVMPKGRSGYIRLGVVDDADGNRLPKTIKVGEHRATFVCWDLTEQTVTIGGVKRVVRFATKIGTVTRTFVNGSIGGPDPRPQRLPLPDSWH